MLTIVLKNETFFDYSKQFCDWVTEEFCKIKKLSFDIRLEWQQYAFKF